jgi:hypothetical protein
MMCYVLCIYSITVGAHHRNLPISQHHDITFFIRVSQYIAFYKWLQQGNSNTHIKQHTTADKGHHATSHTTATTSSSSTSSVDDDSSKQGFGAQAIIHFGMHGKYASILILHRYNHPFYT